MHCGKSLKGGSFQSLFYVQARAPGASGRLSVNTEGFSLRRIVLPSKYSLCLPVNQQSTEAFPRERKWTVKKPFCIQRAQKALFSASSMMITVLKDTVLQYFKHRNTHWRDGHTWVRSGKFSFSFHWNTLTWRLLAIVLSSVTQRACHCRVTYSKKHLFTAK